MSGIAFDDSGSTHENVETESGATYRTHYDDNGKAIKREKYEEDTKEGEKIANEEIGAKTDKSPTRSVRKMLSKTRQTISDYNKRRNAPPTREQIKAELDKADLLVQKERQAKSKASISRYRQERMQGFGDAIGGFMGSGSSGGKGKERRTKQREDNFFGLGSMGGGGGGKNINDLYGIGSVGMATKNPYEDRNDIPRMRGNKAGKKSKGGSSPSRSTGDELRDLFG